MQMINAIIELLLQNIHTRGQYANWDSINALIRDLRRSTFKNLHTLPNAQLPSRLLALC